MVKCVCVCVTPRCGALSATGGPCCRLPAYPRILLGASHTWVAHSSWTLHIQIAVMNIIREEQRGDVRGACTHIHTHTRPRINTYVCEYDVVQTKHNHVWHVGRRVQCEWDIQAHVHPPPPPCAHFRPDLYPSVSHKAVATHADTYGDTSFSPRRSARLASPLQAQASQLRWEPPASLCLCKTKLLHRAGKTTSDLHEINFKKTTG